MLKADRQPADVFTHCQCEKQTEGRTDRQHTACWHNKKLMLLYLFYFSIRNCIKRHTCMY